jgi:hypothetical protein
VLTDILGNHEEYEKLPHGNLKRNNHLYKRTKPSVINEIKKRSECEKPIQLFENMCSEKTQGKKLDVLVYP